jgi:hypothetical protein
VIKKFLKWLGVIYEPPVKKEEVDAWPFPVGTKKKRPQVKKATTRKVVAKKATTVAKKTTKAKKK